MNLKELDFLDYKQIEDSLIDRLYTQARIPSNMPLQRTGYLLRGDFGLTDMELEVVKEEFDNFGGSYGLNCLEYVVSLHLRNSDSGIIEASG